MSDYLPTFKPGQARTMTAGAALTGGQVLTVNTDGSVSPSTVTASPKVVGVAGYDANTGDRVTVYGSGVHAITTTGTVTAGNTVESGVNGTVAAHTNGTNDVNIIGLALTTAPSGGTVRVQWQR